MKKAMIYILLAAILIMLGGCGKPEEAPPADASDTERPSDISIDPDSWGKDNSLDAYSAAVHMPLLVEAPENAVGRGMPELFLGTDRAYYYARHLLRTAKESWDELSFVTADEEKGSRRFDFEDRFFGIGPVAGTDHYIGFDYEESEDGEYNRYFLTEMDENHKAVKEIPLDFLTSPAESLMLPSYLAVDGSGIIHLVWQEDEGRRYLLVSPEGELLASTGSDAAGLVPLYDGRIAFWELIWDSNDRCTRTDLQYMDRETGKPIVLASLKKDTSCITLLDANTLLYADDQGVYSSSLSGENPEPLYRWMNHGISALPKGILALQADAEGGIALIYQDSENYNYLCLKPTTEEVEICEITLATTDYGVDDYKAIVTEFNKRYPRWHIELKGDYDETALLTQLGAGDGPVLVDTSQTGFEELEKLWEPLDTVMEQLGITEELVPSVLELGKINGVQYGIVPDFYLSTLITRNQDVEEWDYDTFLRCVADSPELEAVFDIYAGGNYGTAFILGYFIKGIDDSCFWDAEAGTTNFGGSEFRQALELAKKYCTPEDEVPIDSSLLGEKVLCNRLILGNPQMVAGIRIYYGEDANCIGYPRKDGSAPIMGSSSPLLAIRKTATDEEKEVAIAFLNLLLSYEGQQMLAKDINFNMSVRRDVLEEQIADMNQGTRVELGDGGAVSFSLGDQVNLELDRNTLMHLIETAEPAQDIPEELDDILHEELEQYFSGTITEDILIDRLESRVGLYLNERK